ncbi:MAG: hypothetical protein KKH94_00960 [Candidatus Omnitrophica bacterium]|nr:hypothetical protein [Candidatus Omnitrophota bacterium]
MKKILNSLFRHQWIGFYLLFIICYLLVRPLHANNEWEEYDTQWVHRNPQARLTVLERALKHYQTALSYINKEDFQQAERFAKDALKVIPEFGECYLLLADIYTHKRKDTRAQSYKIKGERLLEERAVLEEIKYLRLNIERLTEHYKPSRTLDRIVFYILFLAGYAIVIFLIITSGFLTNLSMKYRRMVRFTKERKEKRADIIIEEFPGDEKESMLPWPWKVAIYAAPFVFCYLVSIICGARAIQEVMPLTFLPGLLIAVIIHKMFFSDDDLSMPPRMPRM